LEASESTTLSHKPLGSDKTSRWRDTPFGLTTHFANDDWRVPGSKREIHRPPELQSVGALSVADSFPQGIIPMTLKPTCLLLAVTTFVFADAQIGNAGTIAFGSGGNQFSMDFVPIGSPGNAADTTGNPNPAGAVGYAYRWARTKSRGT
jgi:hypothetical protein